MTNTMNPVARVSRGFLAKALAVAAVLACSAMPVQAKDVVVFAAASLKNALDEAGAAWERASGRRAVMSYAASNVLAKQIEAGAPADLFFSADLDWMDYAAGKRLIKPESRTNLLGNALVLIAPKDSSLQVPLQPGVDLGSMLGHERIAMGHVEAVPAGKYGKAALEKLGAWEGVKGKIAQAENVRAALLLVSRREAPLGIVYKTDAASDPGVRIVATFPENTHPPIVYPVALVLPQVMKNSSMADAESFLSFLRSEQAGSVFEKHGFTAMRTAGSGS